jgi:HK97 family phage major capsid protein
MELKNVELKTTMTTGAGFAPANDRTSIVIPSAQRRPVIQDYIPTITTDLDAISFMEETTFTNATDARAEDTALPESALAYTERTTPMELIGTFLPVTEQQLEIAEAIRGTIDNRLTLMLLLKEESEILSGDASAPNLVGFYNKSGIQTHAKGTDSSPDAIYKLFQKLRGASGSGFVEPSLVVIHPNDWTDIRLLKDGNGNYIWGNPSEAGPERIWGKPAQQTTAATEHSALSGDFPMFSQLWRKRAARIDAGWQNDDFVKNKITLKITSRICLVIYRAAAFGTATGL